MREHWIINHAGSHFYLLHDADPQPSTATVLSGYEVVATLSDSDAATHILSLLEEDYQTPDIDPTGNEWMCPLCLTRQEHLQGDK
jgi:hypothetical protein